jgi:hypothetical protein
MASTSAKVVSAMLLLVAMIVLLASFEVGEAIKWEVDGNCYKKYYASCINGGETPDNCKDIVGNLCSEVKCILCKNGKGRVKV